MAADPAFRDEVLDLLAPIEEISCRSMFGGYGIFAGADMFALISGSALFFKVDDSNRAAYDEAGSKKYGPMPYFSVPDQVFQDSSALLGWARTSIAVAKSAPKKKK